MDDDGNVVGAIIGGVRRIGSDVRQVLNEYGLYNDEDDEEEDEEEAGRILISSTRPTLNLLPLLRASV